MVEVRIGEDHLLLTWEEWEERVGQGRIPAQALVRFEPVTGSDWRAAGDLEMYRSAQASSAHTFAKLTASRPPPLLTALLLGIQIRVWWVCHLPGIGDTLERVLPKWTAPVLEDGEVWRLLTMGMLHLDAGHLLVNGVWFAYTGWHLERALGARNLAILFFASVLGGGLASLFGSPDVPSLGSSGGVFGMVSACVVFGLTRPEILPERMQRTFGFALLPYLVLMLVSGLSTTNADNWAHLGGAITGGLLALFTDPPGMERREGWARRWQGAVLALSAAVVGVLGVAGPSLMPTNDDVYTLRRHRGASTRPLPSDADRPLAWSIPAGWRRGALADGSTGYRHPIRPERAWSVRVLPHAEPQTAQQTLDHLTERLSSQGWQVSSLAPSPTQDAKGNGSTFILEMERGDARLRWVVRVVPRGLESLVALWQVPPEHVRRLNPLSRRLFAQVHWPEPPDVEQLVKRAARYPGDPRMGARVAQRLAEVGQTEASLERWQEVVASPEASADALAGYLTTLRWYPEATNVASIGTELEGLLRRDVGPKVEVEVVRLLHARGQTLTAIGLAELAWRRRPGERTLGSVRRQLGLSNALDDQGRPRTSRWDAALDQAVAPAPPPTGPPTLDDARAQGEAWAQARNIHGARVPALVASDRIGEAFRSLLLWRDGHPPAEPEAELLTASHTLRRHAEALGFDPDAFEARLKDHDPAELIGALGGG